jgi:hypothetical protein
VTELEANAASVGADNHSALKRRTASGLALARDVAVHHLTVPTLRLHTGKGMDAAMVGCCLN